MTDLVGASGGFHVSDGGPGTISYIETQLRAIAPYPFELSQDATRHALLIDVGSEEQKRDMEGLIRMHGANFIPMIVRTEVRVSRDMAVRSIVDQIVTAGGVTSVTYFAGTNIHDAFADMMQRARQTGRVHLTSFNGQQITVGPDAHHAPKRAPEQRKRRINLEDE